MEWIEAKAEVSILRRLQLVAIEIGSEPLVIIDGATTYHPCLLQKAKEGNGENVSSVLSSGGKPVGIHAFTAESICDWPKSHRVQVRTLHELLASSTEIH